MCGGGVFGGPRGLFEMMEELKKKMLGLGYPGFRDGQEAVIQRALDGRNSLVLMPTGMGKSFCYQSIALVKEGLVLVVSPLIALMRDQAEKAKSLGIQAADIHSLLSSEERKKRYQGLKDKKYQLILVSPERFRVPEFLEALEGNPISLFAIDEAHCISEWGHDFRPEYTRMGEVWKSLGQPPLMALTATATPEVQEDIRKQLQLPDLEILSQGFLRTNLALHVRECFSLEGKKEVFQKLSLSGPVILYFSLISTLEKFSEMLEMEHVVYHSQMKRSLRDRSQKMFLRGEVDMILATPAFGLGIDKSNIRHIVHMEVPGSIESYYQEVGRAGRDGQSATNYLLYDEDDVSIQMDFIKWANPDPEFIKTVYSKIQSGQFNDLGIQGVREQLNFKNKKDFRLETVLNLLERWDVLGGSLEKRDLHVLKDIPPHILNPEYVREQLKSGQMKLLKMIQLINSQECRMQKIMEYFGVPIPQKCGVCDNCEAI